MMSIWDVNGGRRWGAVLGLTAGVLLCVPGAWAVEYRSIDGSGNNLRHPEWGKAKTTLLREASGAHYTDGANTPAGAQRPNPREISNKLCHQSVSVPNSRGLSDVIWQWGQFVDHDLSLTKIHDLPEDFDIPVPPGDRYFDPEAYGDVVIRMRRARFDPATGTDVRNPRQQLNDLSTWLDASHVYGSDAQRAAWIRTFRDGKLRTLVLETGVFPPLNDGQQDNMGGQLNNLFVCGDIRANEQPGLLALHTLFVREHNRICDELQAAQPHWDDETLYQEARRIVAAQTQVITYNEFLPALLGPDAMPPYAGYKPEVHPGVSNAFSTAGFRLGHTLLSSVLKRVDEQGNTIPEGDLLLVHSFLNVDFTRRTGIDPVLRGMCVQRAQEVDIFIIDPVRNFLNTNRGQLDLISLNLQRGRDHGLADYNTMRSDFGLARVRTFDEITSNRAVAAKLKNVYGSVDNIDPWIGGVSEDHVSGGSLGPLLRAIVIDQFVRVRDGDRFWYEKDLQGEVLEQVRSTRLSDIIRRNTDVQNIPDNVFFVAD